MIEDYFFYSVVIISIGIFFDSLHSLYYFKSYYSDKTGLFNFNIIYKRTKGDNFYRIAHFLSPLINGKGFLIILSCRLFGSLLLIFFAPIFSSLVPLIFVFQLLFNIRNKLALSGADQMRTILLFGLSIMSFKDDFFYIGIAFIIIQMYISYFFTGYNKLKSPTWRKGNGLIMVLNNDLFGNMFLQKFLIRRGKMFNQIICWSIIAFQLFFPILASVEPTIYFILFVGILFHLSLAYISNLNDFFWTYVSAYPLIYFFATKFTEYAL